MSDQLATLALPAAAAPTTPPAYAFEVYADHRVLRGVCSNAPLEEVVAWMNRTSVFRWAPARDARLTVGVIGREENGSPICWGNPEPWPVPCTEAGKAETHQHYVLRSGA
jgi:hypothetical protein